MSKVTLGYRIKCDFICFKFRRTTDEKSGAFKAVSKSEVVIQPSLSWSTFANTSPNSEASWGVKSIDARVKAFLILDAAKYFRKATQRVLSMDNDMDRS
jgi:hypothetical protein